MHDSYSLTSDPQVISVMPRGFPESDGTAELASVKMAGRFARLGLKPRKSVAGVAPVLTQFADPR
jgi:hypothetical protein